MKITLFILLFLATAFQSFAASNRYYEIPPFAHLQRVQVAIHNPEKIPVRITAEYRPFADNYMHNKKCTRTKKEIPYTPGSDIFPDLFAKKVPVTRELVLNYSSPSSYNDNTFVTAQFHTSLGGECQYFLTQIKVHIKNDMNGVSLMSPRAHPDLAASSTLQNFVCPTKEQRSSRDPMHSTSFYKDCVHTQDRRINYAWLDLQGRVRISLSQKVFVSPK